MEELKKYLMFRDFIFPFIIIGLYAIGVGIYLLIDFIKNRRNK